GVRGVVGGGEVRPVPVDRDVGRVGAGPVEQVGVVRGRGQPGLERGGGGDQAEGVAQFVQGGGQQVGLVGPAQEAAVGAGLGELLAVLGGRVEDPAPAAAVGGDLD